MLDAGIDVFSTVNVQHLESLNDRVAELTGVRVRETFPDSVLAAADEVVLVDLTPEALIDRLRAGKVYPAERVAAALNNFFKIENLAALREVALRQVAEEVESKRLVRPTRAARHARGAARPTRRRRRSAERLLALVTPRPRSQRLVRRAWRSAQRLRRRARPPLGAATRHAAARRGARAARGAAAARPRSSARTLLVERGRRRRGRRGRAWSARARHHLRADRAAAAAHAACARLGESLPDRLVRKLPGVDVRIVADRARRREEA